MISELEHKSADHRENQFRINVKDILLLCIAYPMLLIIQQHLCGISRRRRRISQLPAHTGSPSPQYTVDVVVVQPTLRYITLLSYSTTQALLQTTGLPEKERTRQPEPSVKNSRAAVERMQH